MVEYYFDGWMENPQAEEFDDGFVDGYYDMIAEDCRDEYPDDFGRSFE